MGKIKEENWGVGTTVVTGLHYGKEVLRAAQGLTFIFDPNWVANYSAVTTFPICFFHVKGMHEIMESEISTKQMLFYNSQLVSNPNAITGGVLNVVADNIVIKPKEYQLDVIIPYSDLTLLFNHYTISLSTNAAVLNMLTGNRISGINQVTAALNIGMNALEIIKVFLKSMVMAADLASATSIVDAIIGTPDFNKNSLEAMWRNRSILKMKVWNSWRYKYVILKSANISKEPTEDGVYEASLVVQEVPIMTIRSGMGIPKFSLPNPIVATAGNVIKAFVNAAEAG